ncbi:hypothetical protein KKF84_09170, partial [Myxococcota bacterium]|nr:hypothetical protein [Myxococcota bacterium]MBU1535480.1 hypothetical protein [Myxococcota bacterium]
MDAKKTTEKLTSLTEQIKVGSDCSNVPRWVRSALLGAGLSVTMVTAGCGLFGGPRVVYAGPPNDERPPRKESETVKKGDGMKAPAMKAPAMKAPAMDSQ